MDFSSLLMRSYELSKENRTLPVDLTKPFLRPSLKYVYPLFIFLHACASLVGGAGNAAILVFIARRRLYRNPMYFFLANLALCDLLKAAIVSPITLSNLLLENFIFGSFMCFFLPMMHSFPTHVTMLTYTMVAVDRYRFIVHPMKSRVPAGLCTIAVWVISVCVVLPYAVYIKYVDLKPILSAEVGLCMVDHDRHIEEYIRAMFVIFYCLPLAVITFLYVKVSAELKVTDIGVSDDNNPSYSDATYNSHVTCFTHVDTDVRTEVDDVTQSGGSSRDSSSARVGRHRMRRRDSYDDVDDDLDLDVRKERRTQKYMVTMVTLFATCWCPISVLILVTHFVYEDDDNRGRFDVTFLTFTFIGYLSTCINPVLFASWRMSEQTKNRLKGYFQFSNRRRHPEVGGRRRSDRQEMTSAQVVAPSPVPPGNMTLFA